MSNTKTCTKKGEPTMGRPSAQPGTGGARTPRKPPSALYSLPARCLEGVTAPWSTPANKEGTKTNRNQIKVVKICVFFKQFLYSTVVLYRAPKNASTKFRSRRCVISII